MLKKKQSNEYNKNEYYDLKELAIILSISRTPIYNRLHAADTLDVTEFPNPNVFKDRRQANSFRVVHYKDFENYLYENKCFDFESEQFDSKRTIEKQFMKLGEVIRNLKERGIKRTRNTLVRWITEGELPAYYIDGTYIINIKEYKSWLIRKGIC